MASTTTAQVIIDDAELLLQDESNDRWSAAEHLAAVNAGMKEICIVKPDAYASTGAVTLAKGIVQDLPTGGFQLMEITRNMGVSPGATPGTVIRLMDRRILDAMNPSWTSLTASATVEYYMYDERFPLKFSVCPPQPTSAFGYVEMTYAKAPTVIAADATILIPDIYRSILLDYVMFRAFSKDAGHVANLNRASAYESHFGRALGLRQAKEEQESPK